ncbi:MAG: glycosyltransferase family 39 protein [Sphingobacteriales bacterium]|nr:glycosyltransferase family 39 protein [Sphingobacteriales bacterium]
MNDFLKKNHRFVFFGLWLLLALMQAGLTELQDDEAYYWVYSKFLDWGYFDHPPMIALLVKAGYAIFPNELGVRLFALLLNFFSIVLIEQLTDKRNPLLFYGIALSIAVIQVAGFIAVPDTPLIFFTALYFLLYKKFIQAPTWRNTFLLGVIIALLFYTKYQAVLIVIFTLLSNLKLFAKRQTYIAGIIALVLFLPHLIWQWEHNWISFRYHLFESNVDSYRLSYTGDYLLGQLLLAGPVAGILLLPAAFLYKAKTETEKALKFTMIGLYVFFLLSSFRGSVEANWTSPAVVPLIILSFLFLNEKLKWRLRLFKLLPVTLLLVLFTRIAMIIDIVPIKSLQRKYHAWKEWPAIMKEKTKGLPVVFSNSYQRASKYWFYSGQMALSQNLYTERRNNYNFWPIEKEMVGKPVYFLDIYDLNRFTDLLKTPIGVVGYKYDSSFLSFETIRIPLRSQAIGTGDSLRLRFFTGGYGPFASNFLYKATKPYRVYMVFFKGRSVVAEKEVMLDLRMLSMKKHISVAMFPGLPKGKYKMMFSIAVPGYNPTHNSEKIKLIVE